MLGRFLGLGTGLGLGKVPACGCALSVLLPAWVGAAGGPPGFCFPRGGVLGGVGVWGGVCDGCSSPCSPGRATGAAGPWLPGLASAGGGVACVGGCGGGWLGAWIGGRLLEYLRGAESCEVAPGWPGAWPGGWVGGEGLRVDGFGDRLGGC